jgi:hypothetical protein
MKQDIIVSAVPASVISAIFPQPKQVKSGTGREFCLERRLDCGARAAFGGRSQAGALPHRGTERTVERVTSHAAAGRRLSLGIRTRETLTRITERV